MLKVRCFQPPGQPVRIVIPNERLRQPNESDNAFIARIGAETVAKDPSLAGLPFVDINKSITDAMPRAQRHKWRIQGQTVAIDPTVPDPPHPRQARLDAINAATTVDQLKTELSKFIKGE